MINEKHDCVNCQSKEICKWCEEMQRNKEEVNKIAICKGLTPIFITVKCNKFQRKNEIQGGFLNDKINKTGFRGWD